MRTLVGSPAPASLGEAGGQYTLASHSSRLMNQIQAGMLREGRRGNDDPWTGRSLSARPELKLRSFNDVGLSRLLNIRNNVVIYPCEGFLGCASVDHLF
jgi:hypothetical protein